MADLYGLLGKNIAYSRSPDIFRRLFEKYAIDAEYRLADIPDIRAALPYFQDAGWKGFNVTIPYKKAVIPYLDILSDEAAELQVVNTVVQSDGKRAGYNTDVYGFRKALEAFALPENIKALILGNGATAQTVQYVVLRQKNIPFTVVSRRPGKDIITYDAVIPDIVRNHRLIIHTTPLGNLNHPGMKPSLPYFAAGPEHFFLDLNYNPPLTPFLEEGLRQGATVRNGLGMLIYQALKSFEIWTGIQAEPEDVL